MSDGQVQANLRLPEGSELRCGATENKPCDNSHRLISPPLGMTESDVEAVDLLVVGGGKAGRSLAMDRAQAGWHVVMVERDQIGGTCIDVACIPTKTLVGSAGRC